MVNIRRGQIWWCDFGIPSGSMPGYRRPVAVVQDNGFNQSRIATVIVAAVTSNTGYADLPGNVFLTAQESGLPKDSVINVSQIATVDRKDLEECAGRIPAGRMQEVDDGLKLVMGLS